MEEMSRARAATPSLALLPDVRRHVSARMTVAISAIALAAISAAGAWWGWLAPRLPSSRLLAVLAPTSPGADEDFAHFALGSVDLLNARLQKHQDQPGFQLASFQEGLDENVGSASDARRIPRSVSPRVPR